MTIQRLKMQQESRRCYPKTTQAQTRLGKSFRPQLEPSMSARAPRRFLPVFPMAAEWQT